MMSNPLRVEFNRIIEKINQLLDENDVLRSKVQEHEYLNKELSEVICDETFVLEKQSAEMIKQIDTKLLKSMDIAVTPSDKKALVIFMMDNSGSMGLYEKYIGRCFYERLASLLSKKYVDVNFKFIHHTTSAEEVQKGDFFVKGESGGTISSTAFKKANEMVESFDYIENDVYVFHITDGDNLTSDNERVAKIIQKLLLKSKFVGYLETNQFGRRSTLMQAMKNITSSNFGLFVVRDKYEVLDALKHFVPVIFK